MKDSVSALVPAPDYVLSCGQLCCERTPFLLVVAIQYFFNTFSSEDIFQMKPDKNLSFCVALLRVKVIIYPIYCVGVDQLCTEIG